MRRDWTGPAGTKSRAEWSGGSALLKRGMGGVGITVTNPDVWGVLQARQDGGRS